MTDKPDRAEVEGMRWMYLCRQPNDGVYFLRNTPSDAFENIDMILVPDQSATLAAALRDAEDVCSRIEKKIIEENLQSYVVMLDYGPRRARTFKDDLKWLIETHREMRARLASLEK